MDSSISKNDVIIDESAQPNNEKGTQQLEQFGYKQELTRSFSMLQLIAMGIVTLTPCSAIANTLQAPLETGGSQLLVWGYIIVSVFTMIVAVCLAEIGAVFPLAGGPLSWSYQLSSPRYRALTSWYTGYFNIFAQIAFAASASFQGTVMILGMSTLKNPEFMPDRFVYVLVSMGFIIFFTLTNIFFNKYHSDWSLGLLIYNVLTVLVTLITLLATLDYRHDGKYIFTHYTNETGFSSHGYVFILGLLQSAYTFTGYDGVTHLAEESTGDASKLIPKALVTVVGSGIIYGFVFVIIICAVLGDAESLTSSPTGSAYIQLVLNCTKNDAALIILSLIPTLAALIAAEMMTLANSRTIYAFARDGAFIFPSFFSKVSPRFNVPIPALLFSMAVQIIIVILYFSSDVVFNTIISLCTIGHELCYLIPIICMAVHGRSKLPAKRPWNLGKLGLPLNLIAIVWLLFISITMLFPTLNPVDAGNMNYTVVIMFIVIFYATILWIFQGRKTFKGPSDVIDIAELYEEDVDVIVGSSSAVETTTVTSEKTHKF